LIPRFTDAGPQRDPVGLGVEVSPWDPIGPADAVAGAVAADAEVAAPLSVLPHAWQLVCPRNMSFAPQNGQFVAPTFVLSVTDPSMVVPQV
jgi:hypothetical protein